MPSMVDAIAAVEQAVGDDADRLRLKRLEPASSGQLRSLRNAVTPRALSPDVADLLEHGGLTPFQRVRGGTTQLVDQMAAWASADHDQGMDAELRNGVEVGANGKDYYFVVLQRSPDTAAPVLLWSTNALIRVPVAPSLRSLFLGFAAAVDLWRRTGPKARPSLDAWWEPLTDPLATEPIPGVADALRAIYRQELPTWPNVIPVWGPDHAIDPYWEDVLG